MTTDLPGSPVHVNVCLARSPPPKAVMMASSAFVQLPTPLADLTSVAFADLTLVPFKAVVVFLPAPHNSTSNAFSRAALVICILLGRFRLKSRSNARIKRRRQVLLLLGGLPLRYR